MTFLQGSTAQKVYSSRARKEIQVNSGSSCFLTAIKPRQSSFGSRPRRLCEEPQVPRLPTSSPGEKKVTANTTRHVQLAGHTAMLPEASVPPPACV
ncbi:hypothetical protein Q7C36_011520 [Tachysurus vachellii]|uniref:Uncharacterized protein n=1 Tax=Tachysurus vachellii TaxID=175792 RepID=A0AA88MQX3_TACVA|nr:hypothetical protein Q7C36_011520 [Tachysurus vachellii]